MKGTPVKKLLIFSISCLVFILYSSTSQAQDQTKEKPANWNHGQYKTVHTKTVNPDGSVTHKFVDYYKQPGKKTKKPKKAS